MTHHQEVTVTPTQTIHRIHRLRAIQAQQLLCPIDGKPCTLLCVTEPCDTDA